MIRLVLIFSSAVILAWYLLQTEDRPASTQKVDNAFKANQVELVTIQGDQRELTQASQIEQTRKQAPILLTRPQLTRTEAGQTTLRITSQTGHSQNNILTLEQQVRAIQNPESASPIQFETERLHYNSTQKTASTELDVKVFDSNHLQTATGMTLNLVEDTMELKDNVKGYFKHIE